MSNLFFQALVIHVHERYLEVLDPSTKMSYFTKNWDANLVKELISVAEDLVSHLLIACVFSSSQ